MEPLFVFIFGILTGVCLAMLAFDLSRKDGRRTAPEPLAGIPRSALYRLCPGPDVGCSLGWRHYHTNSGKVIPLGDGQDAPLDNAPEQRGGPEAHASATPSPDPGDVLPVASGCQGGCNRANAPVALREVGPGRAPLRLCAPCAKRHDDMRQRALHFDTTHEESDG